MKLILAPMATLSHEAFRRTVEKFGGCDEYFTEMINAPSLLNRGPFEKFYLENGPVPEKIVWQLTGHTAEPMALAAKVVASYGGIGVDLNMGCSAPQIYKTGAGIAWMLKPAQETAAMVRGVRQALDEAEVQQATQAAPHHMRLSVKLRLGDDDFTPEGFFSFCDMLISNGIEMITIHPRTKKQKYREHAQWPYVEQLALRYDGTNGTPNIPVILNGDISDKASCGAAVKAAPHAAGIMIARAAVQKPWIFSELRGSPEKTIDMQQLALDFITDVEKYQPEEFWKTRLQRFFAYYCLNFSFAHYFQSSMLNAKDNDDSRARVEDYFSRCPEDKEKKV
jgi:tRNA-dihydrouridine synthase